MDLLPSKPRFRTRAPRWALALGAWPNHPVGLPTRVTLAGAWVLGVVFAWVQSPYATLPGPAEVFSALSRLWWERQLGIELGSTLVLIGEALAISVVISLGLAYGSVMALLRPLTLAVTKLRFIGVAGLVLPFTLMTGGGHHLKVALLVAGISTFLTTATTEIVAAVPAEKLEYLRVLGFSEWGILWEGIVRGTLSEVLDAIRQNLAMAWAMITMVEGISRAEGGIGACLANTEKHFQLAEVYAVLLVVLVVGLALDWIMGILSDAACPYARDARVKR